MKDWLDEKLCAAEAERARRWLATLTSLQYAEAVGYLFGYLDHDDAPALPEDLDELLMVSMPPEARRLRSETES